MLVWTRSAEDWLQDREWLCGLSQEFVSLPCIQKQVIPEDRWLHQIPPGKPLVLTSPFAVAVLAESVGGREILAKAPVLYVAGDKTRQALPTGLTGEIRVPPEPGVSGLTVLIKGDLPGLDLPLVAPGAANRAGDLGKALGLTSRDYMEIATYHTLPHSPAGEGPPQGSVLCFASPSAVAGFLSSFKVDSQGYRAVVIGETTEAAARKGFKDVTRASSADLRVLARTAADLYLEE